MFVIAVGLSVIILSGCKSDAQTGAGIGAAAGAGIGQLAGGDTESTLIGAAVGAGAGYIIGDQRDKKETKAEMDQLRREMNEVSVNITNSNGSVSQVKLTKQGTGYTGPKGEYYDHLPTEQELKQAGYGF
jgi:hypothetical protein